MPITGVTVDYVNQPKPGKKMGSIKTQELGYVGVWPDKLDLFQQGRRYVIEYEVNGEFKKFVRIKAEEPAPSGGTSGASRSSQAKEIFVTGVIGRYLQGAGTWPTGNTLALMVAEARDAWETAMEGKSSPKEETEDKLDDEIPF